MSSIELLAQLSFDHHSDDRHLRVPACNDDTSRFQPSKPHIKPACFQPSNEPHRHLSDRTEIRLEYVARLNRQRRMAGAGRYHLAGPQRHAELAQFIGEPGQRDPGIAKHVLAMPDILLPRSLITGFCSTRSSARQSERRGRAEHEQMRAGIVRDDLRWPGADKVRKTRIRNFDRRMQRVDRVEHLLHAVGGRIAAANPFACERRIRARRRAFHFPPSKLCRHPEAPSRSGCVRPSGHRH